jgi:hypothetical protein
MTGILAVLLSHFSVLGEPAQVYLSQTKTSHDFLTFLLGLFNFLCGTDDGAWSLKTKYNMVARDKAGIESQRQVARG